MRDLRLAFFGDSLVNGTGDREMLGWCGRLAALAATPEREVTCYNLGVRHQTSAELLARLPSELAIRMAGTFEKRAVISIGFNDTMAEGGILRVPPQESGTNLAAMADAVRACCPLLVVGPPTSIDADQDRRIRDLSAAFSEVCAARRVPFIPVRDFTAASPLWRREAAANDGRHPRGTAYAELARMIAATPAWAHFLA